MEILFDTLNTKTAAKNCDAPQAQQRSTPRRLHSVRQAEDYSGESRSTLYAAMKAGTLKFVKMGRSTRIEHDELNRYIDAKIEASS